MKLAVAVLFTLLLSHATGNEEDKAHPDVDEEVVDYDLAADYDGEVESGGEDSATSEPESGSFEPVEEEEGLLRLTTGNESAAAPDLGEAAANANGTLDSAANSTAANDTAAAAGSSRPQLKRAACRPRTAQNDSLEVEIAEPIVSVVNGSTFLAELSEQGGRPAELFQFSTLFSVPAFAFCSNVSQERLTHDFGRRALGARSV